MFRSLVTAIITKVDEKARISIAVFFSRAARFKQMKKSRSLAFTARAPSGLTEYKSER